MARVRYILSFLQQGSPYFNERPEFVSKCEKGNGIGGPGSSDKWISNRVTARQCIEAVRSKYPTANGATIQNSCKKCRCWAEFGMTGWNRTDFNKKHFWGCKFNDKGKHISVIMCIVRPLCKPLSDHCATTVRPLCDHCETTVRPLCDHHIKRGPGVLSTSKWLSGPHFCERFSCSWQQWRIELIHTLKRIWINSNLRVWIDSIKGY